MPAVRMPVHAAPQMAPSTTIVISQVYGGGGNSGALYTNDFIELHNVGNNTVSLSGWTIQYASATGTSFTSVTTSSLSGSLAPGQYYLVQLSGGSSCSGNPCGVALPTPDATGTINMAANAGKVALVNNSTLLSVSCPTGGNIIDFVGYGSTANCFEGSGPAPAPSATTADLRDPSGNSCSDTDINASDFTATTPNARNTASALTYCVATATPTGTATITPTDTTTNTPTNTGIATNTSTSTGTPTNTGTATPTGFLSVLINEVAWAGTGTSTLPNPDDEWIELYNPSNTNTIDLSGWVLKSNDNTPNVPLTGHSIPPKGFLILARKTGTFSDVTPDIIYGDTGTIALSNSGEILSLLDSNGTTIDTANISYGASKWAAGSASPTYASMERRGVVSDSPSSWFTFAGTPFAHDRNNNLINGTPGRDNWALSVTATPTRTPTITRTPTRTPTKFVTSTPTRIPPQPLLVINEFVPRPGHDWNNDGVINSGDEYIEILNHGVIDVNLSGYSLDDEVNVGSTPYRLPAITLKPGERHVFYGSETGLLLGDGGDGVRLLKPNGQLMDAYNYFVVRFPDESYCRLPDNGGADDWNQYCFPTPGLQNSLSESSVNPPTSGNAENLCPIADTLPQDFVLAECPPFGNNIWNRAYWDKFGWYDERYLPKSPGKWNVFVD